MTHPVFDPYLGLGGLHGGYRNSIAQAQSGAAQAAYYAQLQAFAGGSSIQAGAFSVPAKPTIEDAGISAGEIIGYRAWEIKNGFLRSMAAAYTWIPGEVEKGDVSGFYGIHAFKDLREVINQYGVYAREYAPIIIGRILMWGEVIEHEKGYRAEFAAIDELLAMLPEPVDPMPWQFWKRPDLRFQKAKKLYEKPKI